VTSLQQYGPWAVVTGASEGIGRAFAEKLAEQGFHLVLVARREAVLESLSQTLHDRYRIQTEVIAADLSKAEDVERVAKATTALDVGLLVAAAGFGTSGNFIELDVANELNMLDVNCRALTAQSHHFAQRFKVRGGGGIILLSSLVAFQGVPRASSYAATKAYVQTFAEGLRSELKPFKVDVLACAPGPVASGFAKRADMQLGSAEKPEVVAAQALRALGKQSTVRPGFLAKFLGYSLALLPRWGRVKVMTLVMGGMTKHQTQ